MVHGARRDLRVDGLKEGGMVSEVDMAGAAHCDVVKGRVARRDLLLRADL